MYNDVWSADEGIDLFSRGAELVRATEEARIYARYVGMQNSYPGFEEALGPEFRRNKQIENFVAGPLGIRQRPYTNFDHMTDYSATSTNVSATVCSYFLYPVKRHPENRTENGSLFALKTAARIRLVNTAEDAGAAGIPDTSSSRKDPRAHRVPDWNVFGSWHIEELQFWPVFDRPLGCAEWWEQQFPTFSRADDNYVIPPPGFEAPLMPVAPQYPEWIGPSHPE